MNAGSTTADPNLIIGAAEGAGTGSSIVQCVGGMLSLKFANLAIKGVACAIPGISVYNGSWTIFPNSWSCPLPERFESRVNPLAGAVSMTYCRKPIIDRLDQTSAPTEIDSVFTGEYFQSIYITDKYYQGALRSADGKKFCFAGCLFDVDDATDIEDVI